MCVVKKDIDLRKIYIIVQTDQDKITSPVFLSFSTKNISTTVHLIFTLSVIGSFIHNRFLYSRFHCCVETQWEGRCMMYHV